MVLKSTHLIHKSPVKLKYDFFRPGPSGYYYSPSKPALSGAVNDGSWDYVPVPATPLCVKDCWAAGLNVSNNRKVPRKKPKNKSLIVFFWSSLETQHCPWLKDNCKYIWVLGLLRLCFSSIRMLSTHNHYSSVTVHVLKIFTHTLVFPFYATFSTICQRGTFYYWFIWQIYFYFSDYE